MNSLGASNNNKKKNENFFTWVVRTHIYLYA